MNWKELKAYLLEAGSARISGKPADDFIESSRAGPSAGGAGSVFFAVGRKRVRLNVDPESEIEIVHLGGGTAEIRLDKTTITGRIERVGLHCPRQAYITVSEGCLFECRYCPVPQQEKHVKSPDEVAALVERVCDRVDAISITSGVVGSIEEDETRILEVLSRVIGFKLPVGVSIYPTEHTPKRLHELGVAEVKFNIEAATPELFSKMCPGLDWEGIWDTLRKSVSLFGREHVFSNVILGLGETDEEMKACIDNLTGIGVIPIIRPLTPAAALSHYHRPTKRRLLAICDLLEQSLRNAHLNPQNAMTMCAACTGCDLVPGRDT